MILFVHNLQGKRRISFTIVKEYIPETGIRGSNSSKVSNSCWGGETEALGAFACGTVLLLTGAEEGLGTGAA